MLPCNAHFSFQVDCSEMDSDDDVQEIDPLVITRYGHKNYRRKILKEELDPRFCHHSKRHNYNKGKCQNQDGIDTTDVSGEESNNANLNFVENSMEQDVISR
jgi:hypothetical protein